LGSSLLLVGQTGEKDLAFRLGDRTNPRPVQTRRLRRSRLLMPD
jgi:hypothetical protein